MAFHECLVRLREELIHLQEMQDQIHTSPAMVHTHVCHHLEETVGATIEIIEDLIVRLDTARTHSRENRAKINEMLAWTRKVVAEQDPGPVPPDLETF